jgi:hypothetical protein
MYSIFKLNITAACILVSSFNSIAKAQLASDKSVNKIYNKQINEKLAEKNKSNQLVESSQREQNLPSARSSLKDVAKLKIKKAELGAPNNSMKSDEEKKKQLPSNSPKLKQMGARAGKSKGLHLK